MKRIEYRVTVYAHYIHVHVYDVYVYVYTYAYTYIYTHISIYIYIYMCVCVCVLGAEMLTDRFEVEDSALGAAFAARADQALEASRTRLQKGPATVLLIGT